MFIPTTSAELKQLGWDRLDVILVTGDTYIDSPLAGYAIIGRVLLAAGYRVGIIAQPCLDSPEDITRLGEPRLFWGITGGCMDSMVANYTAVKKFRHQDDLTPGGRNTRRPDRAVIRYANLIRQYYKNTVPVVLGGIEASLRRIAHYDYWDNKIRASLLFDAKADLLVYGMAEKTILQLADRLEQGLDYRELRGLCYASGTPRADYLLLPALAEVQADQAAFTAMFKEFCIQNDPRTARGLQQQHLMRYLIHNPPQVYETSEELDSYYNLPFTHNVHPFYQKMGRVPALDTIRFSITTHRGCYGECYFCALSMHQGTTVRSRSAASILQEARYLTTLPEFNGIIRDLGGATANMYGIECEKKLTQGSCRNRRCLQPVVCSGLQVSHKPQVELLKQLALLKGIRKIFVASGIRYDLILADHAAGSEYLRLLLSGHISGQLKIAPEHSDAELLRLMGKPGSHSLLAFKQQFDDANRQSGAGCFLTYYFMAAYPGCGSTAMLSLRQFVRAYLKLHPEQVQIFTPTPSTYATLMYYTENDPFTGKALFVEKDHKRKEQQKRLLTGR